MPSEPINLTGVAVASIGIIGSVVAWIIGRKPQQADYASKLLDATVPAYETLSKRLTAVEAQNEECNRRNDALEEKCDKMVGYLRSVGLDVPSDLSGK